MSVVALIKSHHRPTIVLGLIWCWCAVVIPLWCIIDCTRTTPAPRMHYVCAMDPTTPGHAHTPRISFETLQALTLILHVPTASVLYLHAGRRVMPGMHSYRNWHARPTNPPPKLLLFTSAA